MTDTYLTTRVIADLQASLSDRDRTILATLQRVRVATSTQLERLHFDDTTRRRARQLLAGMVRRRLLARLPRAVGGVRAGSSGFVYTLDAAGQRLVSGHQRRRPWLVGWPFLAHSLAVTELYVQLVEAHHLGRLTLMRFEAEPLCWRPFAGPGGGRVTLKPDAFVVVRLGQYEDRWFVEVDRSTEPAATIARKCETYRRYWQTGTEQARFEVFPRVLFVVPDAKRQEMVAEVCGRLPAETWRMFGVVTADEAVSRIAAGAQV